MSDYYISNDKSKLDLKVIEDFLKNSYWANGRSTRTIETSIENSLCFGVYAKDHEQVGFARVVTDFAVFAWIMDLFIVPEHRNHGLSKLLMASIMNHPELQKLQRWGLATKDAHTLYEKFGFKTIENPELFMEITNSPS